MARPVRTAWEQRNWFVSRFLTEPEFGSSPSFILSRPDRCMAVSFANKTADTVVPFADGLGRLIEHTLELLEHSRAVSPQTTVADAAWVMDTIDAARDALRLPFEPCFVMNDYKSSNFLVSRIESHWQVTGVFDLSEGYFGNGEADLVRQTAHYLYSDDVYLAKAFVETYLKERRPLPGFAQRFRFFMLRDRLIMWDFGTTPGRNWFDANLTFRHYAERYVD